MPRVPPFLLWPIFTRKLGNQQHIALCYIPAMPRQTPSIPAQSKPGSVGVNYVGSVWGGGSPVSTPH